MVLYRIVSYGIVSYCMVFYGMVSYCIVVYYLSMYVCMKHNACMQACFYLFFLSLLYVESKTSLKRLSNVLSDSIVIFGAP